MKDRLPGSSEPSSDPKLPSCRPASGLGTSAKQLPPTHPPERARSLDSIKGPRGVTISSGHPK